jgi:arylsulfatase
MITRMDREIGRIMALLKELGLDANTLIFFSSDNGPTFNGGTDSEFFKSAGSLRGLKTMLYEGGIRVPLVARWPGKIHPGSESDHISAFWDFLPTFSELLGLEAPSDTDGVSILPALQGQPEKQGKHEFLYWEYGGRQAVRKGDWKAFRKNVNSDIELYNLKEDIAEQNNLADQKPDILSSIKEIMRDARTESELFPLVRKKKK